MGKFSFFSAEVVRVDNPKPKLIVAAYECETCHDKVFQPVRPMLSGCRLIPIEWISDALLRSICFFASARPCSGSTVVCLSLHRVFHERVRLQGGPSLIAHILGMFPGAALECRLLGCLLR